MLGVCGAIAVFAVAWLHFGTFNSGNEKRQASCPFPTAFREWAASLPLHERIPATSDSLNKHQKKELRPIGAEF